MVPMATAVVVECFYHQWYGQGSSDDAVEYSRRQFVHRFGHKFHSTSETRPHVASNLISRQVISYAGDPQIAVQGAIDEARDSTSLTRPALGLTY